MIADDNIDAAESLGWCFKLSGYETCLAYDGAAAITRALESRPLAVILDLQMPVLNGYQAAIQIREALGARVLLIAHTAWSDLASKQRCSDAGFDYHVAKGVDFSYLASLVGAHAAKC